LAYRNNLPVIMANIMIKGGQILLNSWFPFGKQVNLNDCECCCRCYNWDGSPNYNTAWKKKPTNGVLTISGFQDINQTWTGSYFARVLYTLGVYDAYLTRMYGTVNLSSLNTTKIYNLVQSKGSVCSTTETSVALATLNYQWEGEYTLYSPFGPPENWKSVRTATQSVSLVLTTTEEIPRLQFAVPSATTESWYLNGSLYTGSTSFIPWMSPCQFEIYSDGTMLGNPALSGSVFNVPGASRQCEERYDCSDIMSRLYSTAIYVAGPGYPAGNYLKEDYKMSSTACYNWQLYSGVVSGDPRTLEDGTGLTTEGGVDRTTE
jgi:hypothetical protein